MKNIWRMTALLTSAAILVCGCGAYKMVDKDATPQEGVVEETQEVIDGERLALDMLEPKAYASADGLELEPGTYISIVGKQTGSAYWEAVEKGAKKAAADLNAKLGYEGSDKIKVVYSAPSKGADVDEQVNILDEELARYPQAVGIALVDPQSCGVQFDLAAQNGISVVTFDTTSEYQGVMARVETDNAAAAKEAAVRLAEAMGEMGEITLFFESAKSLTEKTREATFLKEIADNHPGVTVSNVYYADDFDTVKEEIVAEIAAGAYEWTPDESEEEVVGEITASQITDEDVYQYIFTKGVNTAGIFTSSSELMKKVLECKESHGRQDIELVGFDVDESQLEAMEAGDVDGLVLQNPYGMGYATVIACARAILGAGNEAVVNCGYTWIDQKNIEEEAVQSILY